MPNGVEAPVGFGIAAAAATTAGSGTATALAAAGIVAGAWLCSWSHKGG
jgi:hypothetical protein